VRRGLRAHSDWHVLERISADLTLKGRFWELREAAATTNQIDI
jgi:hypothetical protein